MNWSCRFAILFTFQAAAAIAHAAAGIDSFPTDITAELKNDPKALTELATKYEHAEGIARDPARAVALFCRAAKLGYAEAQFQLAWAYANGRGVTRDDRIAGTLLEMAANLGHEGALKLLPYIRPGAQSELPACMSPDPVAAAPLSPAEEDEIEVRNRPEVEKMVHELAPQYAIDPKLVLALISVESSFDPLAVSPKKAQGLMQLIPETAERFGVKRIFNPIDNIKGGLAYLRWLMAFFKGDVKLVLAAYNAGERAVERFKGIPPYAETQQYVRRITGIYKKPTHPYQAGIVEFPSVITNKKAD
jgi:hypothetical protein